MDRALKASSGGPVQSVEEVWYLSRLSPRGASVRLWGRVDSPRQDRKALRKPGFPFRKVGSRRFGLEPRKLRFRLCGMGFPIDCLNLLTKSQRKCEGMIIPGLHFVEDVERR